jgi:hypothetical protein
MRTTVDVDAALLQRAKRFAESENRTLGSIVSEALVAYLGKRKQTSKDAPFELIVRGTAHGRFPTPLALADIEDEEEMARLGILEARGHGSS